MCVVVFLFAFLVAQVLVVLFLFVKRASLDFHTLGLIIAAHSRAAVSSG